MKRKKILIEGFSAIQLQNQYKDDGNNCVEQDLLLHGLHDNACFLDDEPCKIRTKEEKQETGIDMNRKLDCYAEKETEDTDHQQAECAISYTTVATDMYKLFS